MNKKTLKCGVILACMGASFAEAEGKIYDFASAEFNNKDYFIDDGVIKGSIGSHFQCVLDNLDIAVNLHIVPIIRLMNHLEPGNYQVGFPLNQTQFRDDFAAFSLPVVDVDFDLVVPDQESNQINTLKGINVATLRGSSALDFVNKSGARIHAVDTYEQAILMAKNHRTDAAMAPSVIVEEMNKSLNGSLNSILWTTLPTAMYISKQHNDSEFLTAEVNRAITVCKSAQDSHVIDAEPESP